MKQKIIRGKRILLADDNVIVREVLCRILELDDHSVTEANNGAEALDLFIKGQFDLVVTDLEMPVMRGDELAVWIRQLVPRQPILMITAYENRRADSENPVDSVLHKPFTRDALRDAIASLLSNWEDPANKQESDRLPGKHRDFARSGLYCSPDRS